MHKREREIDETALRLCFYITVSVLLLLLGNRWNLAHNARLQWLTRSQLGDDVVFEENLIEIKLVHWEELNFFDNWRMTTRKYHVEWWTHSGRPGLKRWEKIFTRRRWTLCVLHTQKRATSSFSGPRRPQVFLPSRPMTPPPPSKAKHIVPFFFRLKENLRREDVISLLK